VSACRFPDGLLVACSIGLVIFREQLPRGPKGSGSRRQCDRGVPRFNPGITRRGLGSDAHRKVCCQRLTSGEERTVLNLTAGTSIPWLPRTPVTCKLGVGSLQALARIRNEMDDTDGQIRDDSAAANWGGLAGIPLVRGYRLHAYRQVDVSLLDPPLRPNCGNLRDGLTQCWRNAGRDDE